MFFRNEFQASLGKYSAWLSVQNIVFQIKNLIVLISIFGRIKNNFGKITWLMRMRENAK